MRAAHRGEGTAHERRWHEAEYGRDPAGDVGDLEAVPGTERAAGAEGVELDRFGGGGRGRTTSRPYGLTPRPPYGFAPLPYGITLRPPYGLAPLPYGPYGLADRRHQ
ncbi:hypothetical protein AB0C93_30170 [Streptomyces sp. NPDC048518]|uniref:hypothetical protein n=1 Tax=Streptomyces sp. NPDC048518 TaxID=3155029 RepID=UPI0033F1891E